MASSSKVDKKSTKDLSEYTIYDGPLKEFNYKLHGGVKFDVFLYGPDKYATSKSYKKWYQRISNFEIRDDDVWVLTYPKSGTTWVQEIVWCVVNDLNYDEAKKTPLLTRSPQLELDCLFDDPQIQDNMPETAPDHPCTLGVGWTALHSTKNRRVIKSHFQIQQLPRDLLQSKAKIIYICRDPKDACVSYYYYWKKLTDFVGNFDDFVQLFLEGLIHGCPYWEGVLSYWELRHNSNFLFITYEDLKLDNKNTLTKICTFLGKDFNDEQIRSLVEHTSFESMKNNPSSTIDDIKTPRSDGTAKLCRKGEVGDWKNHMNDEQIQRFKEWTIEKVKNSDFPYYRNY